MVWLAVFRKFLFFLLVYALASASLFVAVKLIPGDPIALRFSKQVDPARVALERERLGLDLPWSEQFLRYHERFISGEWGSSLLTGRSVNEDFAAFFPATLELSLLALLVGIALGAGAALYAISSERPWARTIALSMGSIGLIAPIFWIGLLALVVGSLWLGWFPMGGRFDWAALGPARITGFLLIDSILAGDWKSFGMAIRYLFLPVLCLSVYPAANVSAVLYARLSEPGVRALRVALEARGFSAFRLLFKHMLRVAGAPVVTVIGTTFGALMGGAFLTETVFSWPGLGRYLVTAILERDVFVVESVLLYVILLAVLVATVSDLAAQRLDPLAVGEGEEG